MIRFSIRSKSANAQTFYNFISTIISTGITFFTMPIFTRLLGTEQYGLYSLYMSWFSIIACIISLGCGQGLATGMYAFKEDYPRFRSSILFGGTVMCVIVTVVAILFYKPLSGIIRYPFIIFLLLFLQAAANFIITFGNTAWTYEKKAGINMVVALTTLVFTTSLSLFLLYNWRGNKSNLYMGRVIGVAVPTIIMALIVWSIIFFQKPAGFIKQYWAYSFGFGIPLIFHSLSQNILISSDRLMMQGNNIEASTIGIYSFYYTFVNILNTILGALNNSWVPFLYEELDKKNYDKLDRMVKNYVQLFTVITCGFILLSREVSKIFANSAYWSGLSIIPIIALAMYSIFMYQFPVNYEFFKAKPRIVAYGTALAAFENIIFNAIMIPMWGMYGAAIATLISYFSLAFVHGTVVKKWKEEKYSLSSKPIFIGLIVVIATCVIYFLFANLWIIRWFLGLAMGIYLVRSVYKRKTIF